MIRRSSPDSVSPMSAEKPGILFQVHARISASISAQMGSTAACSCSANSCTILKGRVLVHAVLQVVLTHVRCEDDGLIGQQRDRGKAVRPPLRCIPPLRADFPPPGLPGPMAPKSPAPSGRFVRLAHPFGLVNAAVQHLQVGKDQLQVDGFNVPSLGSMLPRPHGRCRRFRSRRTTWTMASTSRMLRGNLFSEGFAFRGAHYQAGDIYKIQWWRGEFLRFIHFTLSLSRRFVGTATTPTLGLDGAEGIVGGLGARVGNGVKSVLLPTLGRPTIPNFISLTPIQKPLISLGFCLSSYFCYTLFMPLFHN